jgi:hypothetical protein
LKEIIGIMWVAGSMKPPNGPNGPQRITRLLEFTRPVKGNTRIIGL